MKLSKPKNVTWIIAVILGVLGIIGFFASSVPIIGPLAFWFAFAGFALLALGTFFEGL